jgi:hypothetical protein
LLNGIAFTPFIISLDLKMKKIAFLHLVVRLVSLKYFYLLNRPNVTLITQVKSLYQKLFIPVLTEVNFSDMKVTSFNVPNDSFKNLYKVSIPVRYFGRYYTCRAFVISICAVFI